MTKFNFAAFRNAWLDQVADDSGLPPMAFKLAWYFMKDCGRTLAKQGNMHSFRGQDGYAELLGIKTRHVRDLFMVLRERGHIEVKRAGKGNPNKTFPTLFDRHNNADQNDFLTGTIEHFDRHSDDILIGPKVPGNLIEEIHRGDSAGLQPARGSSSTSKDAGRARKRASLYRKGTEIPFDEIKLTTGEQVSGGLCTVEWHRPGHVVCRDEWGRMYRVPLNDDLSLRFDAVEAVPMDMERP